MTCPHIRIDSLRQIITDDFIRNYCYLFFSQDSRERSIVRLVVHYLYGRLLNRRELFRRVFSEMLCNVMAINECVNGVDDILTVYSAVAHGFVLPIRSEHLIFLNRCILPLHKLTRLPEFSSTLTRCILMYLAKDPSLCVPVSLALTFDS